MQLLFIIDPPDELKAYKDTSVAMMRAAQARGHSILLCTQTSIAWSGAGVAADVMRATLTDGDEDWYRPHDSARRRLAEFDAVLMRKDPPFDLEYVTSTWLLSAAEREGARVFNAPDAIRDHNEKLAIAEFPDYVVPTLVTREVGTPAPSSFPADAGPGAAAEPPPQPTSASPAAITIVRIAFMTGFLPP